MQTQGMLSVEELAELAHTGQIDTVLCQFTDLQGRFMGKRVLPDFFLEEVLGAEGLHACLYLLAIDMEMEPLPGYQYASWDTGYGDFRMIPDLGTLRLCPWLEDRKSTRLNSSHVEISYAVFCLKKKISVSLL